MKKLQKKNSFGVNKTVLKEKESFRTNYFFRHYSVTYSVNFGQKIIARS